MRAPQNAYLNIEINASEGEESKVEPVTLAEARAVMDYRITEYFAIVPVLRVNLYENQLFSFLGEEEWCSKQYR
ncbi:MAG: hypothetical protein ACKER6_00050 [Candidatus Hodgkinia cicadicola]